MNRLGPVFFVIGVLMIVGCRGENRSANSLGSTGTGGTGSTDTGGPTHAAVGVSFTDTDSDSGELAGNVTITRAGDESDITGYVLYWGLNSTTKYDGVPISTIAKTGGNLTYTFPVNTAVPGTATYLLVFTENDGGEMGTGVNTHIDDDMPRNLPDSGQTTSYTGTTGEDSDISINPPSYSNNGDGTISDNHTNLMWQRADDNTARNWDTAETYCADLSLADYYDWRLPNPKELISIVNFGGDSPSIDSTYFPGTESTEYWSSGRANTSTFAWYVEFQDGRVYFSNKSNTYRVRCVRGSNNSDVWAQNFTIVGNGTVVHTTTGLTWQQGDSGGTGFWENSLAYCNGLTLGGYSDWRLPNVPEAVSIIDYGDTFPAINTTVFTGSNGQIWTSTTVAADSTKAFSVLVPLYGETGKTMVKISNTLGTRCVRGP